MKKIFALLILSSFSVKIFAASRSSSSHSSTLQSVPFSSAGAIHSERHLVSIPEDKDAGIKTQLLNLCTIGDYAAVKSILISNPKLKTKTLEEILEQVTKHLASLTIDRETQEEYETRGSIIECKITIDNGIKRKKEQKQEHKNRAVEALIAAEIMELKSGSQSSDTKSTIQDEKIMWRYFIGKVETKNYVHLKALLKNHRDEFDNKTVLSAYQQAKTILTEDHSTVRGKSYYDIYNIVAILHEECTRRNISLSTCCVIL